MSFAPFCGSMDAEMLALFGQQLMTVQYYCNACHTPFERVKSRDVLRDAWAHAHTDPAGRRRSGSSVGHAHDTPLPAAFLLVKAARRSRITGRRRSSRCQHRSAADAARRAVGLDATRHGGGPA